MALSINWSTRVITVPKDDMTLVQTNPFEVRELNLNTFRLALKDIEDSEEGIAFPDTHRHNTEVTISGVTYARVIEMINGYTVTFEDGQYAVNLVGANSNVSDVLNLNQVSVRSANSAGLASLAEVNANLDSISATVSDIHSDIQDLEMGAVDLTPVLDSINSVGITVTLIQGDVGDIHTDVGTVQTTVNGIDTNVDTLITSVDNLDVDVQFLIDCIRNKKYLEKSGATWYLVIRNGTDTANILRKALKDKDGLEITDIEVGALARELASA